MEDILLTEEIYVPGDKICSAHDAKSGFGTTIRDGFIYATLVGKVKIEKGKNTALKGANDDKSSVSNMNLPKVSICSEEATKVLTPHIGSIITAKVKSCNPRFVKCSIFAVNNIVLKDHFRGQIKYNKENFLQNLFNIKHYYLVSSSRKDIRATEKDKIEVYKSFRTGDIILARVISLGDSNSYLLSTAENELGVVVSYSETGDQMIPISWNEMQCPLTYVKEFRKVAKVQPDYIKYIHLEDANNDIEDQDNK